MLSVIICTYNRQKYIYNCLKSIADNDFPSSKYEILVVNNNSTDATNDECERFGNDFPAIGFRVVEERNQGLSFARNRGIIEAKGDVLVYVDDDATVNKEYLTTIEEFFIATPEAMAVGGAIFPVYETVEPKWMSHYTRVLITAYKNEGDSIHLMRGGSFPSGGNVAYRKQLFDRVGCFNIDLGRKGTSLIGAEEKALFDKVKSEKMPIYYLPNMILYHIIPASKLTKEYFDRLTISMGKSERIRCLSSSRRLYLSRLVSEAVKWSASMVLFVGFCLKLQPQKGIKLLAFRWNVTKGLLSCP